MATPKPATRATCHKKPLRAPKIAPITRRARMTVSSQYTRQLLGAKTQDAGGNASNSFPDVAPRASLIAGQHELQGTSGPRSQPGSAATCTRKGYVACAGEGGACGAISG